MFYTMAGGMPSHFEKLRKVIGFFFRVFFYIFFVLILKTDGLVRGVIQIL